MKKSKNWDKKWNSTFKPVGKPGMSGNSIAIEFEGKVYDSLIAASRDTDRSISYIKKYGKVLK